MLGCICLETPEEAIQLPEPATQACHCAKPGRGGDLGDMLLDIHGGRLKLRRPIHPTDKINVGRNTAIKLWQLSLWLRGPDEVFEKCSVDIDVERY